MYITCHVFVTTKDGHTLKLNGPQEAVGQIELALQHAGARWNSTVDTWDFGYYPDTPRRFVNPDNYETINAKEARIAARRKAGCQ